MAKKFLRRTWKRYAKLGKGRKKKQVWRKPKGRDNKMREKRKGYPAVVSIGYKKSRAERKEHFIVKNVKDLEKIKSKDNKIIVLGKVGKKKKIEILKEAEKKGISFQNIDVKKLLKKVEKKGKKKDNKKSNDSKDDKKKDSGKSESTKSKSSGDKK